MRYYYEKPSVYFSMYGQPYACEHPAYSKCTLFLIGERGLAVIQQRFDAQTKRSWWDEIDPWLTDELYLNDGFRTYFDKNAGKSENGVYPTVTIRQIMWALKIKPLKLEPWETSFNRTHI